VSSRNRSRGPVARRLREARERKGLSQRQLGILAGLDPFVASPRVNQYERGVHEPSYGTLELFAPVLDVPTSYFFVEDDEAAELMRLYAVSTATQRRKILRLVRQEVKADRKDW
jgi:transcriptional regulator with XRE-family HTH domain